MFAVVFEYYELKCSLIWSFLCLKKRIVRKQEYDDDSDVEHDPNYKNGYNKSDG